MAETTRRVRVRGRVQGVGYRAWAQARALRLGLRGWVRNEPDGSVTAVISGEEAQVERMLADLREGPVGSAVTDVLAEKAEPPDGPMFDVRH